MMKRQSLSCQGHSIGYHRKDDIKIKIGKDVLSCSTSFRNFSFHLDQLLKNNVYINKLSSNLYQTVKEYISRIRSLLTVNTIMTIMQGFVLSVLDSCNSLLVGTVQYQERSYCKFRTWPAGLSVICII